MKVQFYWFVIFLAFSCKQQVKTKGTISSKKTISVGDSGKTDEIDRGIEYQTSFNDPDINSSIKLSYLSIQPIEYKEINKLEGEEKGDEVPEITKVGFPLIRTVNPLVEKFINDTIQGFVRDHFGHIILNPTNDQKKEIQQVEEEDPLKAAAEHELYYTVTFVNERYLGITLQESRTACCGAPASGYFSYPFTFDLANKKFLTIKDIIKPEQMQAFQQTTIALAKMDDQDDPLLPSSITELETSIKDIGLNSFQLTKDNIAITIRNVGVHSSNNVLRVIELKKYPDLFKEDFLKAISE